jgi:hypothetical protein
VPVCTRGDTVPRRHYWRFASYTYPSIDRVRRPGQGREGDRGHRATVGGAPVHHSVPLLQTQIVSSRDAGRCSARRQARRKLALGLLLWPAHVLPPHDVAAGLQAARGSLLISCLPLAAFPSRPTHPLSSLSQSEQRFIPHISSAGLSLPARGKIHMQ